MIGDLLDCVIYSQSRMATLDLFERRCCFVSSKKNKIEKNLVLDKLSLDIAVTAKIEIG